MRKLERDGGLYCTRGHRLDVGDTLYTEPTGAERCRECRTADRIRQRRTKTANTQAPLTLAVLVARQPQPGPGDLDRAEQRWRSGEAGAALRKHGYGPGDLAAATGATTAATKNWLLGRNLPQKRYRPAATRVLYALGIIRPDDPAPAPEHVNTDGASVDAALVVGWTRRPGPWHASPCHNEADARRIRVLGNGIVNDPTRPRGFVGYNPSVGLIGLQDDRHNHWLDRYAAAHGYTPERCAHWYPDDTPSPAIVYQWALGDGMGCRPGCARCASVRHNNDQPPEYECPPDCPQCADEGLAQLRGQHRDAVATGSREGTYNPVGGGGRHSPGHS